MAVYFASVADGLVELPAVSFESQSGTVNNTIDDNFTTSHSGTCTGTGNLKNVRWRVSGWGGVPSDGRNLRAKCRINLTTSGTAPDRSGYVRIDSLFGPSSSSDGNVRIWNTSTGNLATGSTDLVLSGYMSGATFVPFTTAHFSSGTIIEFNLVVGSLATAGTNIANLFIYEFYLEDGAPPGDILGYIPAMD